MSVRRRYDRRPQTKGASVHERDTVAVSPHVVAAFLSPALVLLLVFSTLPMIQAAVGSTIDSSIRGGQQIGEFVGLGNFRSLLEDPVFVRSLVVTITFVILTTIGQTITGLALALALRTRVRGWLIYQSLLLVPLCLSLVVSLTVWRITFDPRGIVNGLLDAAGLPTQGFYLDPSQALVTMSLISIWAWSSFAMLIFLAGLRTIDPAILEASELDGAGPVSRLRHVILPLLRQATLVVVVVATTGNFIVFAHASLVTKGGPQLSTHFLMWEAWNQFGFNRNGVAYAIVVLLILMSTAVVAAFFRILRRAD